ncbi:MAG: acetamidase/formamidase family protein [Streptosporangiaceae bacterium]
MREVIVGPESVHTTWDNAIPPAVVIDSGDVVEFRTQEVSGGQIFPGAPASTLLGTRKELFYPLAGPVYVRGAGPGDALEVEVLDARPDRWGWSAIIPGLGLLPDAFPDPYIRHFDLSNGRDTHLTDEVVIPLRPFCGTMGVATDVPGPHRIAPPGAGAGNIDTRDLVAGSRLWLPVLVPGALFSAGDCHAAQGDGEVCITGIECGMWFRLRFTVIRTGAVRPWTYRYWPAPERPPGAAARPWFATAAIGPDLMDGCRRATLDLIEWVAHEKGLSRPDAYILCSLAADLKISQVVDAPNWCVSAHLPLDVFRR